MLKRDSGTGGTSKMRKVTKKPAKKTPPKTTKAIAKKSTVAKGRGGVTGTPKAKSSVTYTRKTGGKGFKGRTKPTVKSDIPQKVVGAPAAVAAKQAKAVKDAWNSVKSGFGGGKGKKGSDWNKGIDAEKSIKRRNKELEDLIKSM